MAPRFKQLLFQTYNNEQGASAFIGFPIAQAEQIVPFRDALRNELEMATGLAYRTDFIGHWDIDAYVRFFDNNDEATVHAFYSKPWPGCLSWLLRTRRYRDYKAEEAMARMLITIEVSTSHDHPCIVVEKSTLSGDRIAQLIKKVSSDLEMNIVRSQFSYPMDAVLMSNREFDVEEGKQY